MTDFLGNVVWRLAPVTAGSCAFPAELPDDLEWADAEVPGTVASAMRRVDARDIDEFDWWYVASVMPPRGVPTVLTFHGVATYATVFVDGTEVGRISSMFTPASFDIEPAGGSVDIAVRVESMNSVLKKRRARGRWRSTLVAQQGLRHHRTTLLGRAPVYGQLPPVVGLWRPVLLEVRPVATDVRIHSTLVGHSGVVRVRATVKDEAPATFRVGDHRFELQPASGHLDAEVTIPEASPWWPHTHGEPVVYPWQLEVAGVVVGRGHLGFRTVSFAAADGLKVNGVRVFARGGCWVPPDPVRMWTDADRLRADLTRVRDAGSNMVRVVGTLAYEQPEFWSLCAELGILVWQDVMNATFDPPEDPEFVQTVLRELDALVRVVGGNPALAVVSGGSETEQQPTMLGLPAAARRMPLLDNCVPEFLSSELPGTPYVSSSPSSSSGELPTHVGDGVAHYFGVGGYLRPLSDVRTAGVQFAAECLAFSIPPERRAVDTYFGGSNVAGHHPDWKAAVPRDRGSSWDFEDVRDHYVREIFGVDPHSVRRDDSELYLDYGRAAVCEAVSASYSHWRRAESGCGGALVLTLRDLVPGAGWGLLDYEGHPKAPWYSLARLSTPLSIHLVDDGLDGLTIELNDDTAHAFTGTVRVTLYGTVGPSADPHELPVELEPHSAQSISVDRVVGHFADVNHVYRFGTQTYSAVVAQLVDRSGAVVAQATHLIGDRHARQHDVGLTAAAEKQSDGTWLLTVSTQWAAHYVCVDVDGFDVSDSWFHLAPGARRVLTVTGDKAKVTGHVRALNSERRAQIG